MSDDKADNIPEPVDEVATKTEAQASTEAKTDAGDNKLGDLMSKTGAKPKKPNVDLEAEAMAAAAKAISEGEQALETAKDELQQHEQERVARLQAQPRARGKREAVLRALLAVNIVAMIVVALLPSPTDHVEPTPTNERKVEPAPQKSSRAADLNDPFNRALAAADVDRDFPRAVAILEAHLRDKPRMAPSERLSVYTALSNYAARANDPRKSEMYLRKAQAFEQSHSLPEDLVEEAAAALERGDQESLRRLWARFLLQQRQIPSWLYQHVAQAYLQLGDSYRKDADAAEAAARELQMREAAAKLRAEALQREGGK